jgi:hypothetical protein
VKNNGIFSYAYPCGGCRWVNGRKAPHLVIYKGNEGNDMKRHPRPVLSTVQSKAWVNTDLIIRLIDLIFPVVSVNSGKCIIWNSCRVHITAKVKNYCHNRNIQLIVTPGGMTPYLQAEDIGVIKN